MSEKPTIDSVFFYRDRVVQHISRSARRNRRNLVTACLTRATDDDIRYWRQKFQDCRRADDFGKVVFTISTQEVSSHVQ